MAGIWKQQLDANSQDAGQFKAQVILNAKLRTLAGGTTPREVIAKFETM